MRPPPPNIEFDRSLTGNPRSSVPDLGLARTALSFRFEGIIWLLLLVTMAFVFMGNARSLVSLYLCLALVMASAPLARHLARVDYDVWPVMVAAYLLLAVVGLSIVLTSRVHFGSDMGLAGDDGMYFGNAIKAADNLEITHSLYDVISGGYYLLMAALVDRPGVIDLLPMNWMFGAMAVGLAQVLAIRVTGRPCPEWLLIASTVGNVAFSDTVAHLYRDAPMLVFFMLALVAALDERYVIALAAALCAGLVRGANGLAALVGIGYLTLGRWRGSVVPVSVRLGAVSVVAGLVLLSSGLYISRYVGAYGRMVVRSEPMDTLEWRTGREETMMLKSRPSTSAALDNTRSIYRLGFLGYPLRPVAFLFSPVTFKPLHREMFVSIHGRVRGVRKVSHFPRVFEWATTVLWPVIGPLLLFGIYKALKGTGPQFAVAALFVVILAGVAFVSFQSRHKCSLVLLVPVLLAMVDKQRISAGERESLTWLAGVFVAGTLLANVVAYS